MWLDQTAPRPFLLDGAMGTELIARGLRVREECPEAWNLHRPEDVLAVHMGYVRAGAEAIQTNSFGGLRHRLERHGLADRVAELNRLAAELAREAAGPAVRVIGSLGPSGEAISPTAAKALAHAYAEAAAGLADGGAMLIHLETMLHPVELAAAVKGVRQGAPELPVVVSISVAPGENALATPVGVPLDRMVRALEEAAPEGAGVNCSLEADRIAVVVRRLHERLAMPIWARPQAKVPRKCVGGMVAEAPERFAQQALGLFAEGAVAIGGCCGVGPAAIAELRRQRDAAFQPRHEEGASC
jgi:5-methyltetrahydrofolate--homocysteine methyltransferase